MLAKEKLLNQLKQVPRRPGVYIFKDSRGEVLYVGKARSLRDRVSSYFHALPPHLLKTKALTEKITDFDILITDNEEEALALELTLIKKYRPSFNVSYRDDKSYPYVAITMADEFPRVRVTREPHLKGVKYYGPYTKVWALRETLGALRKVFPVCTCSAAKFRRLQKSGSACLDYHIKRCPGPCIGAITPQEYAESIKGIRLFLDGRTEKVIKIVENKMKIAAQNLQFEKAATLRDQLEAAKQIQERQKVVLPVKEDEDCFGLATNQELACVQVFQIRQGKLLGSESYILEMGAGDLLESALEQYYQMTSAIPPQIFIPDDISDHELIEKWLTKRRGASVTIKAPKRGGKRKLLELVKKNAETSLEIFQTKRQWSMDRRARELTELKEQLKLDKIPERIECFDISTLKGREAVGSMVVFEDGEPKRTDYRRFKVKWVTGQDDFSMMSEVIRRRLERLVAKDFDYLSKFRFKPDLIVVDGGKPQLSAALAALKALEIKDIPAAALAKKEEQIYQPGQKEALNLPPSSKALTLLKRIRDEAHRFAITYHRNLRGKKMVMSIFDQIPGIGEKRKKILLEHFGTPERAVQASLMELEQVLPFKIAQKVHQHLHTTGG